MRSGGEGSAPVAIRERIAVCISSNPAAQYLVARGARMAQAMNAELFVLYTELGQDTSEANQRTLRECALRRKRGASIVRLKGKSVAVRSRNSSTKNTFRRWFLAARRHKAGNDISIFGDSSVSRDAPTVDVHIVTQEPG